MTVMAKVVRFHQIGGSEVLQVENLPIAEPGPNEVRIKVEAIGLNRAENFYHNPERFERGLQYITEGIQSSKLKPVITRTCPFAQIVEAHR